ncbi:MAG: CDP-alcohol phosphatidyltransferase family protein [Candidatus Omnitrophota bacterium]
MQKTEKLIKYGDWMDYVLRSISGPLSRLLSRLGASANSVTVFRFILMFFVMYLFSRGKVYLIFTAGILLQLCDILDYVDGDLARLNNKTSKLGEWLEYFENNLQGSTGSLLGFFIILGIFRATPDLNIWILLFFLVFGMHMKKALIFTPIKSSGWVFNMFNPGSSGEFQNTMDKNLFLKVSKMFVWLSTRDINLIFLASILTPALYNLYGFLPLYFALLVVAIAHNITWFGIAFFQFKYLFEVNK